MFHSLCPMLKYQGLRRKRKVMKIDQKITKLLKLSAIGFKYKMTHIWKKNRCRESC